MISRIILYDIDDYGEGETICFYNESGDDDITCLPEVEHQGNGLNTSISFVSYYGVL